MPSGRPILQNIADGSIDLSSSFFFEETDLSSTQTKNWSLGLVSLSRRILDHLHLHGYMHLGWSMLMMNWTSDLQILRHRTSVKKCRGMHHLSYGQRGVPTKTMERFLITRWGTQHHVSRSKELEVHGVTDWKLLHWRTNSSACKEESLVLGVCLIISLLSPQLSIICFSFFFEKKIIQYFV